jgi:hypothetical protein
MIDHHIDVAKLRLERERGIEDRELVQRIYGRDHIVRPGMAKIGRRRQEKYTQSVH